ncbi:unnamed protein product [Didymodactylos carnosus]|uniref:G-protein coupled receptors family 1 profile domain-containing protein n=1 Tax=Didymodactylos carnosus TaxID=1234261 RepID=A0A815PTS2_9BILA|nr:unnamed protein product [Didymodactylos carnosus]CAF4326069.1 unnamed protein product [Didymodactylos carnosus]
MSSISGQIAILNEITLQFARISQIILLILGFFGLTLNTIIFTRKSFKTNSCTLYFLGSTLANYFVIYFVLTSRLLSDGYQIDPGTYSIIYCKIRFYTYYTTKSLASWCIVLACVDRFLSSSRNIHYRQFCRVKIARYVICITSLICALFYVHVLVYFNIQTNRTCDAPPGFYGIFSDVFYLIGYSIIPPLLMCIFGVWTVCNRHNTRHRQIVPDITYRRLLKKDQQAMIMLLTQCILIALTTIPHAIQKLYVTLTLTTLKSPYQQAQDSLFSQVVRSISFVNHSCTFYILTLFGRTFRKELIKLFRAMTQFCSKRTNIQNAHSITAMTEQRNIHIVLKGKKN